MSPSRDERAADGLLEHPAEAFAYYRSAGRRRRSSARRSTWARGRSSSSAGTRRRRGERFGVVGEGTGIVLHAHRPAVLRRRRRSEAAFLDAGARRARRAPASGTSSRPTGSCLDCELMPWSAKAQELLRQQYAAVGRGRAGRRSREAVAALERRPARGVDVGALLERIERRPRARRAVRRRLPALLLAGRVARRPEARPVPPAGHRGRGPRRPGPRLAHGDARPSSAAADAELLLATPLPASST